MARRLGSTPFRELLPDSLSGDSSIRAAAAALDTVLDATTRAIPGVLLYARLARDTGSAVSVPMLSPLSRLAALSGGLTSLPEAVLDHLAWQLHVEGYETAVDVAAKRQLIAGSLLLHRRRGTPWAVRMAVASVSRTMMRTCFHSPKPPVVPCPVHVAGCAVVITRSVICPKR